MAKTYSADNIQAFTRKHQHVLRPCKGVYERAYGGLFHDVDCSPANSLCRYEVNEPNFRLEWRFISWSQTEFIIYTLAAHCAISSAISLTASVLTKRWVESSDFVNAATNLKAGATRRRCFLWFSPSAQTTPLPKMLSVIGRNAGDFTITIRYQSLRRTKKVKLTIVVWELEDVLNCSVVGRHNLESMSSWSISNEDRDWTHDIRVSKGTLYSEHAPQSGCPLCIKRWRLAFPNNKFVSKNPARDRLSYDKAFNKQPSKLKCEAHTGHGSSHTSSRLNLRRIALFNAHKQRSTGAKMQASRRVNMAREGAGKDRYVATVNVWLYIQIKLFPCRGALIGAEMYEPSWLSPEMGKLAGNLPLKAYLQELLFCCLHVSQTSVQAAWLFMWLAQVGKVNPVGHLSIATSRS